MSRRNAVVDRILSQSSLYQALDARRRRTMVALLKRAYELGKQEATEGEVSL